ncbi:MAG: DUF1232 domain-containing protein [Anaerolineae bacterium]
MQIIKGFIDQLRMTWRLLRDPRVPFYLKAIPFLGLIYVVSPIDFVPDLLPVLGQLDDVGIILAALKMFETLAPGYIVEEHRQAMQFGTPTSEHLQDVIDGSRLRVETDEPAQKAKRRG